MAVLTDDEKAIVSKLEKQIRANDRKYKLLDRYHG